jgi:hypothetical protein
MASPKIVVWQYNSPVCCTHQMDTYIYIASPRRKRNNVIYVTHLSLYNTFVQYVSSGKAPLSTIFSITYTVLYVVSSESQSCVMCGVYYQEKLPSSPASCV